MSYPGFYHGAFYGSSASGLYGGYIGDEFGGSGSSSGTGGGIGLFSLVGEPFGDEATAENTDRPGLLPTERPGAHPGRGQSALHQRSPVWDHRGTSAQLFAVTAPTSSIRYEVDVAGNLFSVTDVLGNRTSYTHDPDGNVISVTDPDPLAAYNWTWQGGGNQVEVVTIAAGPQFGSGWMFPMGGSTVHAISVPAVLDPLPDHVWAFKTAFTGRLGQTVSTNGTAEFAYDPRGQLTGAEYDYQSGDHNRLLSDGTYDYQYDAEGNRTRRIEIATGAVTEYVWDHRNRLIAVLERAAQYGPVLQSVQYVYDTQNRWIARSLDADGDGPGEAVDTYFVHQGSQIILQLDGDGVTNRYLWGPAVDQLLADEQVTLFAFTGRPRDEATGLQNNLNRWYDADTGRCLSEDPVGFTAGDANLYRYVESVPTVYVDSEGLEPPEPDFPRQEHSKPNARRFSHSERAPLQLANKCGHHSGRRYRISRCKSDAFHGSARSNRKYDTSDGDWLCRNCALCARETLPTDRPARRREKVSPHHIWSEP